MRNARAGVHQNTLSLPHSFTLSLHSRSRLGAYLPRIIRGQLRITPGDGILNLFQIRLPGNGLAVQMVRRFRFFRYVIHDRQTLRPNVSYLCKVFHVHE